MTFITWSIGAFLGVAAPTSAEMESSPQGKRAISAAAGHALQGNIGRALAELKGVPDFEFGAKDSAIRSCMIERFAPEADGSLPTEFGSFSNRAIGIFRAYWRASLLHPETRVAEEQRLERNLARLVGRPIDAEPSRIAAEVKNRFTQDNLRPLTGRTPPLLELIAWSRETRERKSVPLPEGKYEVTVVILDDFASLGWSAYATCGRSFTGGWVKPDGIYAVRPGWKNLEDENFRISFLAHETQHFADKERFPLIEPWELEYRAKLTELALAEMTIPRLIAAFEANQGNDPSIPHSFANERVLIDLRRQLALNPAFEIEEIARGRVNQAARTLLQADSSRRAQERE